MFALLKSWGPVTAAAQRAATSPHNAQPPPTDAQKKAGNYKKGHLRLHGLDISIENPRGSTRSGVSPNGKRWRTKLAHHYGYVRCTEGKDGDHVDVFIGPHPESELVFVVNQAREDGKTFDEHKVMLGFRGPEEAEAGYLSNYEKGWKCGPITVMRLEEFKRWLADGDTTKPIGRRTIAVDFDGVLNRYNGRYDEHRLPGPADGAPAFLKRLSRYFKVVVHTARTPVSAVAKWLKKHGMAQYVEDVTNRKPPAFAYVDDLAVRHRGDFEDTYSAVFAKAASAPRLVLYRTAPQEHVEGSGDAAGWLRTRLALIKARVRSYTRRDPRTGKLVQVQEYENRRLPGRIAGLGFVSPNVQEGLSTEQAAEAATQYGHRRMREFCEHVDGTLGLRTVHYDALGDWKDGSENTLIAVAAPGTSPEALILATAVKAKKMRQKAAIAFVADPKGPGRVYGMVIDSRDVAGVRSLLDKHRIDFRTLKLNRAGGWEVYIASEDGSARETVRGLAKEVKAHVKEFKGHVRTIGDPAFSSRERADTEYAKVIREYGSRVRARVRGHDRGRGRVPVLLRRPRKNDEVKKASLSSATGAFLRKADVLHPGIRGGKYWIDKQGHVRYDEPPRGRLGAPAAYPAAGEHEGGARAIRTARHSQGWLVREGPAGAAGVEERAAPSADEDEEPHRREAWVSESQRDLLEQTVNALNRRAEKLGLPKIEFSVEEKATKRIVQAENASAKSRRLIDMDASVPSGMRDTGIAVTVFRVQLEGKFPKIKGWQLLGRVEHGAGGENLVLSAPGRQLPERFRTAPPKCEHCGLVRRRNDTFVLREAETGKIKQVGRDCLQDFLGGQGGAESLLSQAEAATLFNQQPGDVFSGGPGSDDIERAFVRPKHFVLHGYLPWVAMDMRKRGWHSASRASITDLATADVALDAMMDRAKHGVGDTPNDKDQELAERALQWARELKATDLRSDFLWNLHRTARAGVFKPDLARLAGATVFAYQKHLADRAKAEGTSHRGTVGKREVFRSLTLQAVVPVSGYYGDSALHKFVDADGNVFVWFRSGSGTDLDIGSTYDVKATVKKHDERRGEKQTVITRAVASPAQLKKAMTPEWLTALDREFPRLRLIFFAKAIGERGDVQHPGTRGGRYYIDRHGHVRYGEKPTGRVFVLRGEDEKKFHERLQSLPRERKVRALRAAGFSAEQMSDMEVDRALIHLRRRRLGAPQRAVAGGAGSQAPTTPASQASGREAGRPSKQPRQFTSEDLVPYEKPLPPRPRFLTLPSGKQVRSFQGEVYTADPHKKGSDYLGSVWRVGPDEYVVEHLEYGKRTARLPGSFKKEHFEQLPSTDLGRQIVHNFRLKRPGGAAQRHGAEALRLGRVRGEPDQGDE